MPYKNRTRFFKVLLLTFLITLPIFIFYTSGYRLSFEEEGTVVVTTGGVYVNTDELAVDVYLNEELVEKPRLFRNAYYIQNIETGMHNVVVQGQGLQTWVKQVPVDPYIVTEVSAFNLPEVPQIRPIAEYTTPDGLGVFIVKSTSTELFSGATTVAQYMQTIRTATSSYQRNEEYNFVESLFVATTSTTSTSLLRRIGQEIELLQSPATTSGTGTSSTVAYPYIERGNMRIIERGPELYATWVGPENSIPNYFCVTGTASGTIAERYGEHVADQIEAQRISTIKPLLIDGTRFCRTEIRLDRLRQTVKYYEFLPNSTGLVLLQLDDGLYVGEIDDRSWQNTQLLYPGDDFEVVVSNDNIYIKENGIYFELLTEIPS